MTLIFDERQKLQGQCGLHALIIGVSAYPYLQEGTEEKVPKDFELGGQLKSEALTAYKMYRWLLERRKNFPVPLATIRLLVSPSPEEVNVQPDLEDLAYPGTYDNFCQAVSDWREDASTNAANMTLFYFAGHGIKTDTANSSILLMQDVGKYKGKLLRNAVPFHNIYAGMAVCKTQKNIARTQLYFVDACRHLPRKLKDYESMKPSDVFDIPLSYELDNRRASIFYATVSGAKAAAIQKQQTVFSDALLKCLNDKYLGESAGEDGQGKAKWHLTTFSLHKALKDCFKELNQNYKQKYPQQWTEQDFEHGGKIDDVPIVCLDDPPLTDIIVTLEPSSALDHAKIEVKNRRKIIHKLDAPIKSNPCRLPVPLPCEHTYKIIAKVDPPHSDFKDKSEVLTRLYRPSHRVLLKMTP